MDPKEERQLGIDIDTALEGWERPIYMIHEHHSRTHHFDLRLESNGVLRSWAVPKGLSTEPGVKRLAREVPDHALSYASFEGTIEEGSYGAGEVKVWDRGTFETKEEGADKLVVDLQGKRIQGVYHMVRTRMGGDPHNWLVFLGVWPPKTSRPPKPAAKSVAKPAARPTSKPPSKA